MNILGNSGLLMALGRGGEVGEGLGMEVGGDEECSGGGGCQKGAACTNSMRVAMKELQHQVV